MVWSCYSSLQVKRASVAPLDKKFGVREAGLFLWVCSPKLSFREPIGDALDGRLFCRGLGWIQWLVGGYFDGCWVGLGDVGFTGGYLVVWIWCRKRENELVVILMVAKVV